MDTCKICKGHFHDSPDELLVCDHKDGFVHKGCCGAHCSYDGKPCNHCKAVYVKKK